MSFLTGTNVELIASQALASSAPATSSTTAVALNNGNGAAYLPIGFFYTNAVGKKIRVVADGLYTSAAATNHSLTLGVAFDTTLGTLSTTVLFLSGAITPLVSLSGSQWHMDMEICVSGLTEVSGSSTGTTANLMGLGWLALSNITGIDATTTTSTSVYLIGTTSLMTAPVNQAYFVEIYGKLGSTEASNLILENVSVYGCN